MLDAYLFNSREGDFSVVKSTSGVTDPRKLVVNAK